MRRIPFKDHFAEARLFTSRAVISVILAVLLLCVEISRLFYLQVTNHDYYTTQSHDNRVKLVPIAPTRGLIFDRHGVVLAENQPAYRLEITPEQVPDMDALLAKLKTILDISDDDIDQFRRSLRHKHTFDSVGIRFNLSDEEVARVATIQHRLPGGQIVAGLNRYYPLGETLAHIVGYVGRLDDRDLRNVDPTNYLNTSHIGKSGIEKYYESRLHGEIGYQQVETNAEGRILRVLQQTPPIPGENIHLTLDVPLQAIAEQALEDYNGAIVAMDPKNGDVLAMVSKPGFNPNLFVNGIGHSDFEKLQKNSAQPLYNRALLGRYPPGSTIKPFIGLAGLKYGVTHEHYQLFCPGFYVLPIGEERKFRDWKKQGHGTVDLDAAITESCDVYFYDLALNLSIDRIYTFLKAFGFGEKTGIDMPIESSGLLPSREWKRRKKGQPWFPGETLNIGIGQGFLLATPLQLAMATATLANRGKRVEPHLLMQNGDTGKNTIDPLLQEVKPQQWDYIKQAMIHVVNSRKGTARRIANPDYVIAGKTGTSQVFGIKQEEEYEAANVAMKLRDHALFIAYAPADNPKIAIAVVVENGGGGGSVAAPIAGKILNHYLAVNP